MAGVFGSAALPLISCIALLVGAVLIILGFAYPSWSYDGQDYTGLWRLGNCANSGSRDCYHYDQPSWDYVSTWLHVTRAFECAAIVFLSLPLVILPVYMYIALGLYYKCMMVCMALCSILATICSIVGVIIYGVNISDLDWDPSWCLIIVAVGSGCCFIGFLLIMVALVTGRPEAIKEAYYPTTIVVDPHKNKLYTVRLDED